MSFSNEQTGALKAPLDKAAVKKNPKGYDYVEGWHAIAEANRIFGFDGWDRQTLEMRQLGDPELIDGKWRVGYHCRVRITVRGAGVEVVRDGSGYGSGILKDLRDAHEGAIKEAETDAMKRALMTFGNPFGLALYDKAQANVIDSTTQAKIAFIAECKKTISTAADVASLASWWGSEEQKKARRDHDLDNEQVEALKKAVMNRRDALSIPQKEAAE